MPSDARWFSGIDVGTRGVRALAVSLHGQGIHLGEPGNPIERYAACLQGVAVVERLAYDELDGVAATCGGEAPATASTGSSAGNWKDEGTVEHLQAL